MPSTMATYVYASSKGQRTHSARTKISSSKLWWKFSWCHLRLLLAWLVLRYFSASSSVQVLIVPFCFYCIFLTLMSEINTSIKGSNFSAHFYWPSLTNSCLVKHVTLLVFCKISWSTGSQNKTFFRTRKLQQIQSLLNRTWIFPESYLKYVWIQHLTKPLTQPHT